MSEPLDPVTLHRIARTQAPLFKPAQHSGGAIRSFYVAQRLPVPEVDRLAVENARLKRQLAERDALVVQLRAVIYKLREDCR